MSSCKNVAVVLAGGQGTRMNSKENKQYMLLAEKPVLLYCLEIMQESFIDEIILVVGKGQVEYCREQFIEHYRVTKITHIVEGGTERYHSVYAGLMAIEEAGIVYIHDGARPCIQKEQLELLLSECGKYKACVLAVPVKDTIKIANEEGFAVETPKRSLVWSIQTPQVFEYELIKHAYEQLIQEEEKLLEQGVQVTDDAMVAEYFTDCSVKLVQGSYHNIKITTPEDLFVAESFLCDK